MVEMDQMSDQHQSQEVRAVTSHLTTLVHRFLQILQSIRTWNQLDSLKGEAEVRHQLSNIIEYTFYFHKQQITEQEVEQLIQLLEKGEK